MARQSENDTRLDQPHALDFRRILAYIAIMLRNLLQRLWTSHSRHRFRVALRLAAVGALGLFVCNLMVVWSTRSRCYDCIDDVPERDIAVVLGSYPRSYYFLRRIEAGAELYKQGKVKHLLVSGDNSRKDYDESTEMKQYLMRLGVPESAITCDYAGFRTLDSMVRAKEIFGVERVIVVSQRFHNYRAVYIARHCGLDAVAFDAQDPPPRYMTRVLVREVVARAVALVDLHVTARGPRFLGKKEPIQLVQTP